MNFNKKITRRIISDLQNAKNNILMLQTLEKNIYQNIEAVDSTFPIQVKDVIEVILLKIEEQKQAQYCATLNTPEEGTYDETLPVDDLFDAEIAFLEKYVG